MRGWNTDEVRENYNVRKRILTCDLDIIGIAETHLKNKTKLSVPGYVWKGQNMKNRHRSY